MEKIEKLKVSGKIVELVDDLHFVLEDDNNIRYYIGHIELISQTNIGKNVTAFIVPRYNVSKIIKHSEGNFKYIYSKKIYRGNNNYIIYFLNKNTEEIISITLEFELNNNIQGENYFLEGLIKNYKVRKVLYDIPENKKNNLTTVTLVNYINKNNINGILEDGTVIDLKTTLFENNISLLLGKKILVELEQKFILINLDFDNNKKKIEPEDYLFLSSFDNNKIVKKIDGCNNDKISVIKTDINFNNNNIGKIYREVNLPLYIFIFDNQIELINKNILKNNYKLLNYLNTNNNDIIIGIFERQDGKIISIFVNSANLYVDKIGSIFNFIPKKLYYLSNYVVCDENTNNNNKLIKILPNNIYVFYSTVEKKVYYTYNDKLVIADSSIGKYFEIMLFNFEYNFMQLDVN